ncbi:MAG: hypothetical protein EXX96DRAFT_490470 [Benjaminiella poitrasii]|nr:MAG: hypothetical protein EXX96DRAFT_490470 [Benjaminiella poitrasii]
MKYEYKDTLLPGTTKINAISIEQDSILYSRDPDLYRFRISTFPHQLLLPPHSEKSNVILLAENSHTGDLIQAFHQPGQTKSHATLLCKMHSPNLLEEFYHTMQVPDSVVGHNGEYDGASSDIRGVQLNGDGTLLAVWTDSNSVYIYKRGRSDNTSGKGIVTEDRKSPHYLERPLPWNLRMMIIPKEGYIGSIAPIGAILFWNEKGSNYVSVGMKNQIVNTYLIDGTREPQYVTRNFKTFLRDKWDLWIVMSMIVTIFVLNEYKTYPI